MLFWILHGCAVLIAHPTYPPAKNPIRFSKLNVGILLQRYVYNKFHSANVKPGISYLIAFHQEVTTDRVRQKNFLSAGIEYLYHSFSFSSYYFLLDSVKFYSGNMNYDYYMQAHECNIPLLFKHNFSRENNDVQGIFFSLGYVYRILLPGRLSVSYQSREQHSEDIRPTFKIPVFNKYSNSYAHVSIGYQKNNPMGKMKMYIELFGRYGFSPFLIHTPYTANNLYFGNYYLGISIGIKWRR